jgi:hypothetical protein
MSGLSDAINVAHIGLYSAARNAVAVVNPKPLGRPYSDVLTNPTVTPETSFPHSRVTGVDGRGRYLVIPRWVVRGQPAGCGVAPLTTRPG